MGFSYGQNERAPTGRIYTYQGQEIPGVCHVEFDRDVTKGMATVMALLRSKENEPIIDTELNIPVTATFRCWVQMVALGDQPICAPEGSLVRNPLAKSPADEPFVFWQDIERTSQELRELGEKMLAGSSGFVEGIAISSAIGR